MPVTISWQEGIKIKDSDNYISKNLAFAIAQLIVEGQQIHGYIHEGCRSQ